MKKIIIATAGLALMAGLASVPQTADAQQRGAPRGSYQQSCTGAYVNQGRLYADCRDTRRNVRESSIQLSRCSDSDIGNDNGLLVCNGQRGDFEDGGGRPDWGSGGGFNNGRDSITVYKDANFRGEQATFQGAVPNLGSTRLNDAVSSMTFRGEWEACTDANFRGRCEVFRNDVRNLDRVGMNDRISSLRPLRDRY